MSTRVYTFRFQLNSTRQAIRMNLGKMFPSLRGERRYKGFKVSCSGNNIRLYARMGCLIAQGDQGTGVRSTVDFGTFPNPDEDANYTATEGVVNPYTSIQPNADGLDLRDVDAPLQQNDYCVVYAESTATATEVQVELRLEE